MWGVVKGKWREMGRGIRGRDGKGKRECQELCCRECIKVHQRGQGKKIKNKGKNRRERKRSMKIKGLKKPSFIGPGIFFSGILDLSDKRERETETETDRQTDRQKREKTRG